MPGCPGPELACESSEDVWPGAVPGLASWKSPPRHSGAAGVQKETAHWELLMKVVGKLPLKVLLNLLRSWQGFWPDSSKSHKGATHRGAAELTGKPAGIPMERVVAEPTTAEAPAKLAMNLPAGVALKLDGVSSLRCLILQPRTPCEQEKAEHIKTRGRTSFLLQSPQRPLPTKLKLVPAGKGQTFQQS